MKNPILSVVMTTYNGENYLKEQLDSIFSQTFEDFQLILSDDCSTDKTLDIIKHYQKKHKNIVLSINEKPLGSVANFEKGMQIANTQYIALSDQDDIWEKNKLQLQIASIRELEKQHPNIPLMVHSDLSMIDSNSKKTADSYFKFRSYKLGKKKDIGHILGPCGVMGNTILINKLLHTKLFPFPKNLKVHDYWIAVVNETLGLRLTLNTPLVRYRIHENNLSNSSQNISKNLFTKLQTKCLLPYINQGRESVLEYLLGSYILKDSDITIIENFLSYLHNPNQNRIKSYLILYKNKLIKKGFLNQVKFFSRVLLCKSAEKKL